MAWLSYEKEKNGMEEDMHVSRREIGDEKDSFGDWAKIEIRNVLNWEVCIAFYSIASDWSGCMRR